MTGGNATHHLLIERHPVVARLERILLAEVADDVHRADDGGEGVDDGEEVLR
jgi:hypothetical protein